jgi:hypothetical protein
MTELERIRAKKRAKEFARKLRDSNWAENVPEDWDSMTDEQIKYALSILPDLGLRRREDWKWEANRS